MGKKVRSAKGQMVDFDLIQIKQQMASQPAPANVKDRERFIDRKVRRRSQKVKLTPELAVEVTPTTEDEIPVEDTVEPTEVEQQEEVVVAEELSTEDVDLEDEQAEDTTPPQKKTKKVRKK